MPILGLRSVNRSPGQSGPSLINRSPSQQQLPTAVIMVVDQSDVDRGCEEVAKVELTGVHIGTMGQQRLQNNNMGLL